MACRARAAIRLGRDCAEAAGGAAAGSCIRATARQEFDEDFGGDWTLLRAHLSLRFGTDVCGRSLRHVLRGRWSDANGACGGVDVRRQRSPAERATGAELERRRGAEVAVGHQRGRELYGEANDGRVHVCESERDGCIGGKVSADQWAG